MSITAAAKSDIRRVSVRNSLAYRSRIVVTIVSLMAGLGVTLLSGPMPVHESWVNWLLIGSSWMTLLAGVGIRLWGTAIISGNKSKRVVIDGPYALCRNPLYWGTFLIAVSMALFLQSELFAVSLIPPILLYVFGVVPAEEHVLKSRFGEEYEVYCQSTARWMPHWNGRVLYCHSPGDLHGWFAECRSLLLWFVLPAIALLACVIRNHAWLPWLF